MTETTATGPVIRTGDLAKLWGEFRRQGPTQAFARVVESLRARAERRFDARYGLDSVAWIPVSELTVSSPNKALANIYGPTPAWLMPRFLRSIPEADFSAYSFIDFGSGKGRAVLLAARHAFARVVGLEFSQELHTEAQANIALFREQGLLAAPVVESLEADVLDYDLPDGPCVLYTFNPFGSAVMAPLLARIEASYRAKPRKIYFIYYDSVDHALFDACPILHEIPLRALGPLHRMVMQHEARLYETRP
jgi:SAM-dependent methyltransferase